MNPSDNSDHLKALLQQALAQHRQGRLAEAKAIYESILQASPGHFEALHLLGAVALQAGNPEAAIGLMQRAVAINPNVAAVQYNLGVALRDVKRSQEALAAFDRALALNPTLVAIHSLRGDVLLDLRRFTEALASYDKAIAHDPKQAETHNNRGAVLVELKRPDDALLSYGTALALEPDNPRAHNNYGVVLAGLARFEEALPHYDRALALDPRDADAHNNRGSALLDLKRPGEALASYERAIGLSPQSAAFYYNRGKALTELARQDEALQSYDKALSLQSDYPAAHINRGNTLVKLRRFDEARISFRAALALDPDNVEAHYNFGKLLFDLGEGEEARAHYARAVTLRPDFFDAHANLIFTLNFLPGETTASQQAHRKNWNDAIAANLKPAAATWAPRGDDQRKLRIGYVSAHFRHQAATYAFAPAILHHDRDAFEVFCYSDTVREDDVTALLKTAATVWRPTKALSDEQLAAQIQADKIDILVDCVGHMKGNRLLTFARKPAPIQITGWGEPTGTGLATMDYLLADPVLVPPAERSLLSEAVIDLPCFLTYWSPDELPAPGPAPALAGRGVTFGSFNRASKLTAPTLELWANVLRATPGSRLLLKSPNWADPAEIARLMARMKSHGVGEERITLIGETTRAEHFHAYTSVDICLDPLPHSGGMTTIDALWMGLPVITLRGATPSSRLAASVLTALDLNAWIAESPAAYVRQASALAADLERLSEFRRTLRARLQDTPVGDNRRYVRILEDRYRAAWQAKQSA